MNESDYLLAIDQMELYGIDKVYVKKCLQLLYKLPRGVMQFIVILQNCHTIAKQNPAKDSCAKMLLLALQTHGQVKNLPAAESFKLFNPKSYKISIENFPGLADQTIESAPTPLDAEGLADFKEKKHKINKTNFPGLD